MKLQSLVLLLLSFVLFSCDSNSKNSDQKETGINIRLAKDPQMLNPLFRPSSIGREVYQYVFLSVANFHPKTMELCPILINNIPNGREVQYKGEKVIAYDLEFRPEAKWSDGTPITAKDYIFTLLSIRHPDSKISAWKPYLEYTKGYKTNSDPRKLTVFADAEYILSKEAILSVPLIPAHIFDAGNKMMQKDYSQITSPEYKSADSTEIKIINAVNQSASQKLGVVQSGPYAVDAFETNQYIHLIKKNDYWGERIEGIPYLENNMDKITFMIVPDELTAVTMAKENKLDLMMMNSSANYFNLKEDENFSDKWTFHAPQLLVYYYMAINNKSKILGDPQVRRAMAHLADVDDYIQTLEGGMGLRTSGHFHPSRSYYNESLAPIEFNIEKAKSLLAEAGWEDGNNDGILEKNIDGKETNLELDILQTGSALGKNVALLFQAEAEKAGIRINVVTKKMSLMRKENLHDYNFDLALLRAGMDEAKDDPYPRWHSDNSTPGGSNIVGYENQEVDALIEMLRISRDPSEQKSIYLKIQKLIYDDTPCVFLYCPLNKVIISNKFKALTTTKRPGYLANTFSE